MILFFFNPDPVCVNAQLIVLKPFEMYHQITIKLVPTKSTYFCIR